MPSSWRGWGWVVPRVFGSGACWLCPQEPPQGWCGAPDRGVCPGEGGFIPSAVPSVPQIYKEQLNTRIVLVAMETWASEDRIRVGDDALDTLHEFVKYRREGPAGHSDTVHLFS